MWGTDVAAELQDPLAELHMEDYDTDEEQGEVQEATASRLFGGGNPGDTKRALNIYTLS